MKLLPMLVFSIITLGLGGYYAIWTKQGDMHKEIVQENLTAIAEREPQLSVTYDEVGVTGFPFTHTVEFENVAFVSQEPNGPSYRLAADNLRVELRKMEELRYLVMTTDRTIEADYNGEKQFEVHVTEYPLLSVRVGDVKSQEHELFEEFAVGIPHQVMLTVTAKDAKGSELGEQKISFNQPPIGMPIWRKIPNNIADSVEIFVLMLDEAYQREAIQ